MKLKRLIFLCTLILTSLLAVLVNAQEVDSSRFKVAEDKPLEIEKEKREKEYFHHDLRIGIDISTIISGAISPIRRGLDLSVEYNLKPKLFLMLEGGHNYYEKDNLRINYKSQGSYIRLGFDYNLRNPVSENDKDIFYMGFRYAYSRFTQEVPMYLLVNGYWGNSISSFGPENGYAHWWEFVTGFKVEILKNWYLGMGMRLKGFINRSKTNIEPVQYVPGYAKNYNSGVMDFNYTIYYNIPLNYKKKKIAVYERKK